MTTKEKFLNSLGYEEEREIKKTISNFFDKKDLAKKIIEIQPFYYNENKVWWYWDNKTYCWRETDETNILNIISSVSEADTVSTKEKTEILEALKQQARKNEPKEIKKTWIQFKEEIFDIKTGKKFKATHEYFVTNPIPYSLNKDNFEDTPTMDKIFEEWVGKEYVKTLYEIIAYCMLNDYPIHRLFCLIGGGQNGKSCFINLLKKFIGDKNCSATELDLLVSSRFEASRKLYKKLVGTMGETDFNQLNKTSILKKATGQDLMGFENKGKTPFDGLNYAKIIIATNNLPETTDKTKGFYRRWTIIDFPNEFSEKIDILGTIPEEEFECLALKCCSILKDLLKKREFWNEGTIEERMKRYEDKSNPMGRFIKEFCCTENPDGFVYSFEFEKRFNEWCKENRFRSFSQRSVGLKLKEMGMHKGRQYANFGERNQIRCWYGIGWKSV